MPNNKVGVIQIVKQSKDPRLVDYSKTQSKEVNFHHSNKELRLRYRPNSFSFDDGLVLHLRTFVIVLYC